MTGISLNHFDIIFINITSMKTYRKFGENTWVEFDEDDCPDLWDLIKFLFWVAVVFVGGVILGNLLGI